MLRGWRGCLKGAAHKMLLAAQGYLADVAYTD